MRLKYAVVLLALLGMLMGSAKAAPIPGYQFLPLQDQAVPTSILKTLDTVETDIPAPYKDRCHVQQNLTSTKSSCLYGDSHALSWFPAIEKLAVKKKWRLLSLTMSSCWPSNIPAWNSTTNTLMASCAVWRKAALKSITAVKPFITFVSGTRGFSTVNSVGDVLTGDERTKAWQTGMKTTLNIIKQASKNTVLISDTPTTLATVDCLETYPQSITACATPAATAINADWLGTESDLAALLGVLWVNPTSWICNTDPCSPIYKQSVIFRDGGHLTATFARYLESPLWADLSGRLSGM